MSIAERIASPDTPIERSSRKMARRPYWHGPSGYNYDVTWKRGLMVGLKVCAPIAFATWTAPYIWWSIVAAPNLIGAFFDGLIYFMIISSSFLYLYNTGWEALKMMAEDEVYGKEE